jgi:hypothetical protein
MNEFPLEVLSLKIQISDESSVDRFETIRLE